MDIVMAVIASFGLGLSIVALVCLIVSLIRSGAFTPRIRKLYALGIGVGLAISIGGGVIGDALDEETATAPQETVSIPAAIPAITENGRTEPSPTPTPGAIAVSRQQRLEEPPLTSATIPSPRPTAASSPRRQSVTSATLPPETLPAKKPRSACPNPQEEAYFRSVRSISASASSVFSEVSKLSIDVTRNPVLLADYRWVDDQFGDPLSRIDGLAFAFTDLQSPPSTLHIHNDVLSLAGKLLDFTTALWSAIDTLDPDKITTVLEIESEISRVSIPLAEKLDRFCD